MLIPNLQEIKYANNGVVAIPHLGSTQLQAKKAKRRQEGSKQLSTLQALTVGLRNKGTRLKRSPTRWGNKGKGFRNNPTTKPRKEFQSGGLTDSPNLRTSSPWIWKSTATHELQPRQSLSTYHHLQNEHKNVNFGAQDQELQRFEGGKKLTICRRTGSRSSK